MGDNSKKTVIKIGATGAFSNDPELQKKLQALRQGLSDTPPKDVSDVPQNQNITVHMRVEKSGRKGKTVTVIEGFPRSEKYLKGLAKKLKSSTGSGGTYLLGQKSGVIEIQGDKREILRKVLKKEGVHCK